MFNFIFILTEGDHDAVFLYRILKANGIKTYNIAIKDYPAPVNKMFMNDLSSSVNEELNIDAINSKFLPHRVMRKNDNILCIYRTVGDAQEETALFGGKIEYDGKTKKKVNGKKYNHKKSLLGTVGQLQMSGKSNTVCISDADYITDEKIKSDDTCNEILSFIGKVMV